jgi:predicted transport protein
MWTCPSCGRAFKRRSQMHTCEVFDLERHLSGKSSDVVGLYHLLAAAVSGMESVEIVPMKSSILFRVKTVFATVTVRRNWLDVYLALEAEYLGDRVRRTERISARRFAHHVRLQSPDDLDEELMAWLTEAHMLSAE